MTPEQFTLWFQGFAELTPNPPDARQWDQIRAQVAEISRDAVEASIEVMPLQIEVDRESVQGMAERVARSMKHNKRRVP